MVSGARKAPTLVPELRTSVPKERFFFGTYSAVALMAAGMLPASPMASTRRDAMKPATDNSSPMPSATSTIPTGTAKACIRTPRSHTATAIAKARLVPMASTNRPASNIEIA